MIPIRIVIGTVASEADMEQISTSKLKALVRDRLAALGSPFPFTIGRKTKDYRDCNWRITAGPMPEGLRLKTHDEVCWRAWSELTKDYNLEPEEKQPEW